MISENLTNWILKWILCKRGNNLHQFLKSSSMESKTFNMKNNQLKAAAKKSRKFGKLKNKNFFSPSSKTFNFILFFPRRLVSSHMWLYTWVPYRLKNFCSLHRSIHTVFYFLLLNNTLKCVVKCARVVCAISTNFFHSLNPCWFFIDPWKFSFFFLLFAYRKNWNFRNENILV